MYRPEAGDVLLHVLTCRISLAVVVPLLCAVVRLGLAEFRFAIWRPREDRSTTMEVSCFHRATSVKLSACLAASSRWPSGCPSMAADSTDGMHLSLDAISCIGLESELIEICWEHILCKLHPLCKLCKLHRRPFDLDPSALNRSEDILHFNARLPPTAACKLCKFLPAVTHRSTCYGVRQDAGSFRFPGFVLSFRFPDAAVTRR
jgi:hypothetical protein